MASSTSIFGIPNPFYTPKTTSFLWDNKEHSKLAICIPMRTLGSKSAAEALSSVEDHIQTIKSNVARTWLPISVRLTLSETAPKAISTRSVEMLSQIPLLSPSIIEWDFSLPIPDQATHVLLRNAQSLSHLSAECHLHTLSMSAIAEILAHQHLNSLHLFPLNPLTNEDLSPLAEGLSRNDSLSTLIVNARENDIESVQFLSPFLALNSTLKTLVLVSRRLLDSDLMPIGKSLQFNFLHYGHSIHTLHLNMDLGSTPAHSINSLRIDAYPLEKLALVGCNLYGRGMQALCQSLRSHSTLHTLFLENNHIPNSGAVALATVLAQNTSLTTIDLYQNLIGPPGARAIGESLLRNSTLRTLNLTSNPLETAGCSSLIEGLLGNSTLSSLELIDTGLIYDTRIDNLASRLSSALITTHAHVTYCECGIPRYPEITDSYERNARNLPLREASLYSLLVERYLK